MQCEYPGVFRSFHMFTWYPAPSHMMQPPMHKYLFLATLIDIREKNAAIDPRKDAIESMIMVH